MACGCVSIPRGALLQEHLPGSARWSVLYAKFSMLCLQEATWHFVDDRNVQAIFSSLQSSRN